MGRKKLIQYYSTFAEKLKLELLKGLPGTEVQWMMASSDRMVKGFPRNRKDDTIDAAVLILLYPVNHKVHTVFIQRPEYDGVHSGQISFPGGKKENTDNDLIQTAIREACEETGIKSDIFDIIGTLTPLFIPVSNIEVTPVIAWSNKQPLFNPEKEEVVFLIEAGLESFMNGSIIKTLPFQIKGEAIMIKCYDYNNNIIWGATAMILHELMMLLKRAKIDSAV
jgi:8-oxo-dGTP pyrophosphatase MutT (NUDIX family)